MKPAPINNHKPPPKRFANCKGTVRLYIITSCKAWEKKERTRKPNPGETLADLKSALFFIHERIMLRCSTGLKNQDLKNVPYFFPPITIGNSISILDPAFVNIYLGTHSCWSTCDLFPLFFMTAWAAEITFKSDSSTYVITSMRTGIILHPCHVGMTVITQRRLGDSPWTRESVFPAGKYKKLQCAFDFFSMEMNSFIFLNSTTKNVLW